MIKGEFKTKAGDIRIEILDELTEATVEITDVSPIKYEFDLLPDSPDVESVLALYQRFEFEIFQYSTKRVDLYQRLQGVLVGQSGVSVKLRWDDDTFDFFAQLADIKLSEVDQLIKVNARVVFDGSVTVLDVFDNIEAEEPSILRTYRPDSDNPGETLDCVGVIDWIEYAMKAIFVNDDDAVMRSAPNGLSANYVQENYTSFRGGVPDQRVAFLMARMNFPELDSLVELDESEKFVRGLVYSNGTGSLFGKDFPLDIENWSIRLRNSIGQTTFFIVDEVVSEEEMIVSSPAPPTVPLTGYYTWNLHAEFVTPSTYLALESLKEIAAIEGAIFGQGFSRNFYVNRLVEQDIVSIDWDDITENDIDPFFNPLGGGSVTQLAREYSVAGITKNFGVDNFGIWPISGGNWEVPKITDGRSLLPDNPDISQEVNLSLAPGYPFLNKGKGIVFGAVSIMTGTYNTPFEHFNDFDPVIALCRTGMNSIKRAISSDDKGIIINFSAFDAKRIKPWNLIRLTGAPSKYQNKAFRPTSIEYDLVHDEVTVTAYELVGVDLPDVPEFQVLAQGSVDVDGLAGVLNEVEATGNVDSNGVTSFTVDVVSFVSAEGVVDVDGDSEQGISAISVAGQTIVDGDAGFKIPEVGATGLVNCSGEVTTTVN